MHSAPAVTYPVGRCHIQGWVTLALWGLDAVVTALWILAVGRVGGLQGLALLLWLLTGGLALRSWLATPAGTLRWDGQQWTWQTGNNSLNGTSHLQLDFQQWILLEFRPLVGRPSWFWLTQAVEPTRWQALRRALCSRAARNGARPAGLADGAAGAGQGRP